MLEKEDLQSQHVAEINNLHDNYHTREQELSQSFTATIQQQQESYQTLLQDQARDLDETLQRMKETESGNVKHQRKIQEQDYEIRRLQDELELLQVKWLFGMLFSSHE